MRRVGVPVVAALLILLPSWLIHAPAGWSTSPEWLRGAVMALGLLLVVLGVCLALAALRHFVLQVFFVVVFVCLSLKENFPFTHYPMYSSFSDYSYVVYLADGKGEALPVETITSVRTSALKKNFGTNLKEVERAKRKSGEWEGFRFLSMEDRMPAGEATLRWLVDTSKNDAVRETLLSHAPLRLYMVELRYDDGEIVRSEPGLVGELP